MVKGKPLLPSGASKDLLFDTTEDLNGYLETPKAKAGQFVKVLERNKLGQSVYQTYVIQDINNVFVPQKVSSDIDFSDLDLKIVDDENDEDKKYLVLGDDSDDETEYARVVLPVMGGGGSSYIVMRLRNLLPSTTFTVPYNQETGCTCELDYTWSSIDTGDKDTPTGNGTAYYYVDGTLVLTTQNLAQGNVAVDLGEYLTPNRVNVIKVTVVDSENNRKSLTYNVNVAYNYITTKFPSLSVQRSNFSIPVIPFGSGQKTIYCIIDDDDSNPITVITRVSSSIVYIDINNLTHGGHSIEIYMTTVLEGLSDPVTSNTLTLGVTYIDDKSSTPLLYARTENSDIQQYSYAGLSFVVSDGDTAKCNINVEVKYSEDGNTYESVYTTGFDVDTGTVNNWTYRVMEAGYYRITLSYGESNPITQVIEYEASAVKVAQAISSGLQFLFDPMNRSNSESAATRDKYSYTNSGGTTYNVAFSDIDFNIFGWTGNSLRIPLGGSMTIPYQPFLTDANTTKGKTIEMCFKIKNVYDYEQNVISCYANSKGIQVTANKGSLNINASDYVEVSYNDEVEVRLSFVITKRDTSNNNRGQLVYVFINSDIAGVIGYSELDRFNQNPATNITIGSEYAEIEVYKVRCYDIALFEVDQGGNSRSYDILNNYIADSPNVDDMIARNARNNVFDTNKMIDPTKLPDNCPYMVIESTDLPQYKGDNKTVSGYFVDKADSSNSFVFVNADLNVQGTSSEGYYVKNFKIKFKNGDQNVLRQEINVGTKIIDGVEYLKLTDVKSAKLKIAILKTIDSVEYIKVSELQENNLSITAEEPVYVTYDEESYVRAVDTDIYVTSESERYIKSTFTDIIVVDGNQYRPFSKYGIYSNSVPVKSFCLKADVASSEGANNIILMKIWDDITHWLDTYNDYDMLTPPQKEDARVRQCIDGRPMVLYWKNASTGFVKFWGKYNFNNDKGTEDTFGFDLDKYPNCEAWDFRDNGLVVTEFKSGDFDNIITYTYKSGRKKGQSVTDRCCKIAFEPIFPDYDEPYDDYTQLHRVVAWVASTNPDNARPNVNLGSNYTFNLTIPVVSVDINGTATDCILHPINPSFGESDNLTDIANLVEIGNNAEVVEKNQEETINGNTVTKLIRYIKLSDTNITSHTGNNCTLTYTKDTVQYRLAKFKNEFEDYFAKNLTILYYIWTDIFLMVDSRAKNQHMVTFDGQHWYFFPYDGDTALGIDNIGALNFDYWLEDDSTYNGSNVYNGQDSVLWNNVKKVFRSEITTMIDRLVSKGFTYEYVKNRFNNHQAAWSEAVFCADTEVKYIVPWFETGTISYLAMAQGSKSSQRDYWLKHRFSYYLSKYMTGTAIDSRNEIQMRMTTPTGVSTSYREVENPSGNPSQSYYYEKDGNNYVVSSDTEVDNNKTYYVDNKTIVVTPFSNTYVIAEFGSTRQKKYCNANESVSFQSTLDSSGDSMLNIFNGAEIKSFGDLSAAYIKRFELGNMATNLETAIVGSEAQGYVNEGLVTNQFSLGNSQKLKVVNVSNCPNLGGNINVSQCYNIREVLAKGSKITSVSLPSSSQIRTLKLPDTITTLSLIDQVNLTTFEMEGYGNLTSLSVRNTPVDVLDILDNAENLTDINITDIDWTFNDSTGIEILNMLADKSAISSNTVNVSGRISVPEINSAQYNRFTTLWRGLTITCGHFIQQYPITFKNYDGTVLGVVWVNDGETTYENITINETTGAYHLASTGAKLFDKPARPYTWNKTFEFENVWDRNLTTRVREAGEYVAQYTETARQYTIKFKVSNVEKYSVDITASDSITYDYTYGKPQKASSNNTWYLPKGWTDTGVEIYTSSVDNSRIFGIFSTLVFNETMLSAFAATVPTVLKPTFVLNAIFQECGLPDNLPIKPTYTEVRNYVSGYDYVYTNDPNYTSAYTLPELYAISMSDKFSLYLDVGDKMRIYFDGNTPVGGDNFGTGHDIAVMEIMGFNVYERADSDFGEYVGNILGTFADPNDASELVGKSAGLYICTGAYNNSSSYDGYMPNGAVYYWDGTVLQSQKVTQYFSHVMWRMALGDNAANNASGKKYGHMMDTTFQMNSSNTTLNGWGDDTASTNKKCRMNQWLNDGISGVNDGKSIFSMFPSELQAIITPVKVISAKGAYYPEGSSSQQFSPAPVVSVSNLFLACYGELWSTEGTPYINEINKWASICKRDASNNLTKITKYPNIVSSNTLICRKYLGTGTDVMYCWTRSAFSTASFTLIYNFSGSAGGNYAGSAFGAPLCFCTG